MFQFRRFPSLPYLIQIRIHGLFPWAFPHSEIRGSTVICTSPRLIAACRVLLRLLMPRHPSCALSSLTFSSLAFSRSKIIWQPRFAKLFESFDSSLCFPEKPFSLISKKFSYLLLSFSLLSLFSFQCAGRDCFFKHSLN